MATPRGRSLLSRKRRLSMSSWYRDVLLYCFGMMAVCQLRCSGWVGAKHDTSELGFRMVTSLSSN